MKYLKPPYFSTALSNDGKALKKRLSLILSTAYTRGTALILCAVLAAVCFIGCERTDAPLPTEPTEVTADGSASALYKKKTPYIGDAPAVGRVVTAAIGITGLNWQGTELQTTSEPYLLILNYSTEDIATYEMFDLFTDRSPLLFALIDNLGGLIVNITGSDELTITRSYYREDADRAFDKSIAEYAETEKGFEELYNIIMAKPKDIDSAVSAAILLKNNGIYLEGECLGEGHIILGEKELEYGAREVYTLAMYSEFGFENGVFTIVSGSGNIPVKMVFDKNYDLIDYTPARDGSDYLTSVREMFPKELVDRAVNQTQADLDTTRNMSYEYAKAYLKKIGRKAEILRYGEFEHTLLTDLGVSVDVSNSLVGNRALSRYPIWVGNLERIEDGIRYVYSLDYKKGADTIRFEKSNYATEEIVEAFEFDAETGKEK